MVQLTPLHTLHKEDTCKSRSYAVGHSEFVVINSSPPLFSLSRMTTPHTWLSASLRRCYPHQWAFQGPPCGTYLISFTFPMPLIKTPMPEWEQGIGLGWSALAENKANEAIVHCLAWRAKGSRPRYFRELDPPITSFPPPAERKGSKHPLQFSAEIYHKFLQGENSTIEFLK